MRVVEHALAALAIDIVLQIARHRGHDLDLLAGEEFGEVLLARHGKNGEIATVDHAHAHVARRSHQPAKVRVELGRAAGDVEGRDAPAREEGEHHVGDLA